MEEGHLFQRILRFFHERNELGSLLYLIFIFGHPFFPKEVMIRTKRLSHLRIMDLFIIEISPARSFVNGL